MKQSGNILFSGVGGQGILLASELTAHAQLAAGFDVKKSEVHGMAQRGGSVEAHLRYGEKVYSPLIEPGTADILVAFEILEAVRYLPYLHPDSAVVVNTQKILPPAVALGKASYPENILDELKSRHINVVALDAFAVAESVGELRTANVAMVGAMSNFLAVSPEVFLQVIDDTVKEQFREVNKRPSPPTWAWCNSGMSVILPEEANMATANSECATRDEIEALQAARLRAQVERLRARVPFWRGALTAAGIAPGDVHTLADLPALPFSRKADFRDQYPYGLLAVEMDDVVRVHGSSGTSGKPIVVAYTQSDIDLWASLMARTLACGTVTRRDVVHNAYGYGLFTGGLGAHYGIEALGATVIPVSGGNSRRQVTIMRDFGSTVLMSTPSYALNLADAMSDAGITPDDLKLRVGIHGAEPWSENMREEVERKLGIKALDIYGLSEVIGPGVSMECLHSKRGMHVLEDNFLPEVIDPETLEPLPCGETGELVFTTLTKEAFPLIRYRTKDISRLFLEPCGCGRTLVRMDKVTGRTDDMLIIRGVNVFPSQVEHVLMGIEGVEPHYQIEVSREGNLDVMAVLVEVSEHTFSDEIKVLERLAQKIRAEIKDMLGVTCQVKLVEPRSIQRSEGKAQRVIDRRKG